MLHHLRFFFSLQNAVYFIMLPFLVPVYSHFKYRVCKNLKVNFGAKGLIGAMPLRYNNVTNYYSQWHDIISKLKYFKNLATCFSYNEPSSGEKQNKVQVHSMIVHCMESHTMHNQNHWMYQDCVLFLAWWWLVVAETCCQVFKIL